MPAVKVSLAAVAALFAATATSCGLGGGPEPVEIVGPAPTAPPFSASPKALPRAYDPKANAASQITEALARAKADGRPVMLDFGARWCAECATLQHIFRLQDVRPSLDRYHRVTIDVGRIDRHLGLARKYGLDLKRTGIPALVVLSPQGDVRTAGNEELYPAAGNDELLPETVTAFLRRWQ
ncbi:thioredoxin family protein [Actinomadura fulvescens]|uniref:Thioredoxin domain-containing protein n=1 Tax=Actinomadura fulvescens TaxID=46160 RepID=A0ABP6C778_9ACTN